MSPRMRRILGTVAITGVALAGAGASADAHTPPRSNGCSMSPDFVPGIYDFTHACNHHDDAYINQAGRSKWAVDMEFLDEMLSICADMHPGRWSAKRQACNGAAFTYYSAVTVAGWPCWNRKGDYWTCNRVVRPVEAGRGGSTFA